MPDKRKVNRKLMSLVLIFLGIQSFYLNGESLATSAVAQNEESNVFLILFVITLLALIGLVIWFYLQGEKNKKMQLDHENQIKESTQQKINDLKSKLQSCQSQGQEIYKKLQLTVNQNKQIKSKFQGAYDQIVGKYKEAKSSLDNLSKQNGFQEELDKVYHQLEDAQAMVLHAEKMSSLGQLTAGIAHEINNPVNFVANGIHTMKENFDQMHVFVENYRKICEMESLDDIQKYYKILRSDDNEYDGIKTSMEESLEDAEYGTTRITEIVNGLRSFSRQDESEIKEAHIHDVVDNALLILKPKYKKKAKVLKDYDHSMQTIKCLPGQLNQVFVNLIGNASDAIDFKGTITIRTTNLDDDNIQLQIQDDGKGISEEVQRKIFDPFYTTKSVGKGTGLGLSITYGIIEKHGGSIKVDSEVGKGTVFTVTIPKKIKLKKVNQ
ncbi:MAG: hypothetical protein JXR07_06100 [Reichenbachiella sp.]